MVYFRKFDPEIYHRRSIRLPGHDYRSPGAYFITLLAADPDDFFGIIENGTMVLNDFGTIVEFTLTDLPNHNLHISLDEFVIMPDHIHGIIVIHDHDVNEGAGSEYTQQPEKRHGLPEIIRQFKTFSARRINTLRRTTGQPVWQRNYYEHIIRKDDELTKIRQYINNNPVRAGSKPAPTNTSSTSEPNRELLSIAIKFFTEGTPISISPLGSGHINDSYLITTTPNHFPDYVLQRINHQIFKDIPGLISNIDVVTRHIRQQIEGNSKKYGELQVLELIPTHEGQLFYTDPDGNFWRMYFYIPGSRSYDRIENPELAYEGGQAFGEFQSLTAGIVPETLAITIPRFHDIKWRLEQFEEAISRDAINRVCTVIPEIHLIRERVGEMHIIQHLSESGLLPVRVTHNDTKFNNILFNAGDRAICIVDLDTIMPGTVLYDFGDAIRTGANTGAEDEANLDNVGINMELFAAYAKGFFEEAGTGLTRNEIDHLAFSAKFMTFIIGLRFFTDHINGDTYYKIQFSGHNLRRARTQFHLLESIEKEFDRMKEIIGELVNSRLRQGFGG